MPSVAAVLDSAGSALRKRMPLLQDRGQRRTLNPEILATVLG